MKERNYTIIMDDLELPSEPDKAEPEQKQIQPQMPSPGEELLHFLKHIESLNGTLPLTMLVIQRTRNELLKKYRAFEKEHIEHDPVGSGKIRLKNLEHSSAFRKLHKRAF